MLLLGLACAGLAAICAGSFGSLSKLEQCQEVHPYIFNFWTCQGFVLSSALLLLLDPQFRVFEPLGLLSGLLYVIATANSFAAIASVGLSVGSGIWSGTAVIVSFSYGLLIAHENLNSLALAISALVVLILGIGGIAYSSYLSAGTFYSTENDVEEPLIRHVQHAGKSAAKRFLGIVSALLSGLFGGLVIAPMSFAVDSHRGLSFIPSMGLGVLLASPIATNMLVWSADERPSLLPKTAAIPGVIAGFISNAGNATSIIASRDPSVGMAVAYPIMQCGLAVAGLWGVLVFREIRGRAQAIYWLSAAVLLLGATLLAIAKQFTLDW
eukprot:CAMPEP_0177597812 /NCGR_PEP_ID=MMETSP0419_2-20121207/11935_1 /TAXON_ID=582737 /ORGANISM="Tetraselmis sp., Strain GSL018" /LENGTH=324 /DNA_ID=CAMNT_0019090055 /DNA_START=269 /DNA_END=1240 /DNA_ORIENTATION=+